MSVTMLCERGNVMWKYAIVVLGVVAAVTIYGLNRVSDPGETASVHGTQSRSGYAGGVPKSSARSGAFAGGDESPER